MTNSAAAFRYNGWHGPEVRRLEGRYTVYMDLLFFINLSMDLLLLLFLKRIMRLDSSPGRIFLAAAAGAAWACGTLYFPFPAVTAGLPGLVLSGAGMAWIAFERGSPGRRAVRLRRLCRETAGLFLSAVLMGGGFAALEGLMERWLGSPGGIAARPALTVGAWGFLAAGTAFSCRILWMRVQEWTGRQKVMCRVRLVYRGMETETDALIDTGNRLFSTEGRQPVHVLEYGVCREICRKVDRVIYIPYQSVGKQDGVIPGIILDRMEIRRGEEKILVDHPLVGIVKTSLSPDGSYRMLLNEKVGR